MDLNTAMFLLCFIVLNSHMFLLRILYCFYRASICEGGIGSRNSVRPSVCLSVCMFVCHTRGL